MRRRGGEREFQLRNSDAYKKSKWGDILDAFDYALSKERADLTGFREGLNNWVVWMKEEGFEIADSQVKEKAFEQIPGITEEIYHRTIMEFLNSTLQRRNDFGK